MSPGKALTIIAKRTGGLVGMAVSAVWKGRDILAKILIVIIASLPPPVMFILMLLSLIFGNEGLDVVPDNVSNDNSVIMANISQTETSIETILRERHNLLLGCILAEAVNPGTNYEYSITDDFSDQIIYESALIISQLCASQQDFKEVQLRKLEQILRAETDGIFIYSVNITERKETIGGTDQTETIFYYEYITEYAGDEYFFNHVFHLIEEQVGTAGFYISNLYLFLYDTIYSVEIDPDLVPGETGDATVDLRLIKLGVPYSQEPWNQPGYFGCSSFTYWVYNQLGVSLQYDGSNAAALQGRLIVENNLAVSRDSLAPGDLTFYSFKVSNRYTNIGHVVIYAEDGYVVDASFLKKKVVYRPIHSINNTVLYGRPYASP